MLVIGHRGAPSIEHENTISSFKTALNFNVDGLEFDVQLTKDYQLIVYHDFHISYNNQTFNISDLNLLELQSFHFDYTIPKFEDVLKICPSDKIINIEIKSTDIKNTKLVIKIIDLVIKYKLQKNVIISSFNPFVLLEIKKQNKQLKIGLLWTKDISEKWYVTKYSYKILTPYSFHADIKYINKEISLWVHGLGMKLFIYTVNDKQQLKISKELDADAIFSDHPKILR